MTHDTHLILRTLHVHGEILSYIACAVARLDPGVNADAIQVQVDKLKKHSDALNAAIAAATEPAK